MDADEMVAILCEKFPYMSEEIVRSVLTEHDFRLQPALEALTAMSARQGSSAASSSAGNHSDKEAQLRRDALLARSMQTHSISDSPSGFGSGSGSGAYGSSGYGSGGYGSRGSPADNDAWTETINTISNTLEENVRTAVNYASTLGGWASNLIANLDPTSLLFEDEEDFDYPGRPPPDTSKDREGVSIGRSPLTQRSRLSAQTPQSPPRHSDEEGEEEEDADFEDDPGANIAAWLGADDDVSYVKKDK